MSVDPSKCDATITCDDCGEDVTYDIRRPAAAYCGHCANVNKRYGAPADTENAFAMRARAHKAAAIAGYIRCVYSAPLPDAPGRMGAEWWQCVARQAGVNADKAPSQITRSMVLGLLDAPALAGLTMPDRRNDEEDK